MAEIYGIYHKQREEICYVGQTIIGFEKRWKKHLIAKDKKNLHYAIDKYGADSFEPVLLETCDKDILNEREIHYIEKYDTYRNGYNQTIGGETVSGYKHTDITKQKLRTIQKKRWKKDREYMIEVSKKRLPRKQSAEERAKRSEQFKENNPMFRKEVRDKLSETRKKQYQTGELENPMTQTWSLVFEDGRTEKVVALKRWARENDYKYNSLYSAWTRQSSHKDIKSIRKLEQ